MEVPEDVKNKAILGPSNCTTRHLPQRYRCREKKGHMHPNVYRSNVHNSQTVEGAEMPFNRRMDKKDVVHIWNITQPSERTITQHLHRHGWNWRDYAK